MVCPISAYPVNPATGVPPIPWTSDDLGQQPREEVSRMPGGGFHPPYPSEFKAEAVRLVRDGGRTISELVQSLGVTPESIRQWRKQADLDAGRRHDGLTTEERQ